MDVHRIDPVVVDDRTKSRTGEGDFGMWVFSLQEISMVSGCKGILAEIIKSEKCSESDTAHAAHQCTFLGIDTVWEDPFVSGKMQGFIFVRIVSLLEYGYIIGTALVEECVFVRVDRINLKSDDFKIFTGDPAGIFDLFHRGFATAFTGQDQDLLKTCFGDGCHFFFNFFLI